MFIQWNDDCKLGIPNIDADHRLLVELVNKFFARAEDGAEFSELGHILDDLIDETAAHFRREEVLLDRHDYPLLVPHAAEHERLLAQLRHFQTPYATGTATRQLPLDTAEFLRHWLVDHIRHDDQPYKSYLMRLS